MFSKNAVKLVKLRILVYMCRHDINVKCYPPN